MLFVLRFGFCHTSLFVSCGLVVTCWEMTDLLALLYMLFYCHFPIWHPVVLDCIDS